MHTWKRTHGRQVVTRDEGAAIGTLNDFQFDLADRHIYGWRLKGPGMFAPFGGVSSETLLVIGRDVAIVQSEKSVEWSNAGRNAAEGRAWAGDYRGTTVVDQRGRAMGSVQDFVFDALGARLTGFVLRGNLLLPLDDRVPFRYDVVVAVEGDRWIRAVSVARLCGMAGLAVLREEAAPEVVVGEDGGVRARLRAVRHSRRAAGEEREKSDAHPCLRNVGPATGSGPKPVRRPNFLGSGRGCRLPKTTPRSPDWRTGRSRS